MPLTHATSSELLPDAFASCPAHSATFTRRQTLAALGALALPGPTLLGASDAPVRSAPASPVAGGPDLGNLHPVIEALVSTPPRRSFLDSRWSSLEEWKAFARPFFLDRLAYRPEPVESGAKLVHRERRDGFTLEVVRIRATAGYDIPARVLVPDRPRDGRAVIALHCHAGRFTWGHEKLISHPNDSPELIEARNRFYGRPWAEVLARHGYVVLVSDAFYFGERRLKVEALDRERVLVPVRAEFDRVHREPVNSTAWIAAVNSMCAHYENLTAKTILAAGATWPGILVWDDIRTVDYLATRRDVNPARIGCTGLSLGALRANHLIAADSRIKVACVIGWMTSNAQQLRNHMRQHTWMGYVPGIYRELDLPDVAALHAPGALLVQQCRRDILYPVAGMESAVRQLARSYEKAGVPERFRGSFYDEPHSFRPHMQDEALAWLDRWL